MRNIFHEHHYRSLLKSITWFILAFSLTFITLSVLNKDWKTGFWEAITLQIIKALLYYIHERLWNKSGFGQKIKSPIS